MMASSWTSLPFVCPSVLLHDISKTDAARITKQMFHYESWKPIYFWVIALLWMLAFSSYKWQLVIGRLWALDNWWNGSSTRPPATDEETMRPVGDVMWWWWVVWVSFSVVILLVGWPEGHLAQKNVFSLPQRFSSGTHEGRNRSGTGESWFNLKQWLKWRWCWVGGSCCCFLVVIVISAVLSAGESEPVSEMESVTPSASLQGPCGPWKVPILLLLIVSYDTTDVYILQCSEDVTRGQDVRPVS